MDREIEGGAGEEVDMFRGELAGPKASASCTGYVLVQTSLSISSSIARRYELLARLKEAI